MSCYTYLVRCQDGSLYCGWTNHLDRRMKAHNEGKGAKYTKSRRPVELVYYEEFSTKADAMRREWAIKQMTRAQKWKLIRESGGEMPCPQTGQKGTRQSSAYDCTE